jgi:hypothetical protein
MGGEGVGIRDNGITKLQVRHQEPRAHACHPPVTCNGPCAGRSLPTLAQKTAKAGLDKSTAKHYTRRKF